MNLKRVFFGASIFLMMAVPFMEARAEVGGTIFLNGHYALQPEDDSGYNAFDVTRTYLTVKGSLPETEKLKLKVNYRATVDFKQLVDGYKVRYLKYGYVEFADVWKGLKFRFGQHPVPWVGFSEKIFGFRFVTKSFADRVKKLSSTDVGVSALWSFPQDYGDIHVSVVNGEGYHKAESNKYKDFMGRVSIRPLPKDENLKGLRAHVYFGYGVPEEDKVRNRMVGALSYQGKFLTAMGEYLGSWDGDSDDSTAGSGFGGFLSFNLGKLREKGSYGVLVKAEQFDPDTDKDDDAHLRIIGGVFCEPTKGLQFTLDYQTKTFEDSSKDTEGTLFLHAMVKF